MALRIRCRPSRIKAIATGLARRPDTVWVDILGSGDEISSVLSLDGPQARVSLLLRDLPALAGLYAFLTETVGSLGDVRGLEVTPILSSVKRTGLLRPFAT
jgi:hypothetical protein